MARHPLRPAGALHALAEAEVIVARNVVVTVGAWGAKLLSGTVALPTLVVTEEQPAHFAIRGDTHAWPGFNHAPDPK